VNEDETRRKLHFSVASTISQKSEKKKKKTHDRTNLTQSGHEEFRWRKDNKIMSFLSTEVRDQKNFMRGFYWQPKSIKKD
jgi:hypothetical protein